MDTTQLNERLERAIRALQDRVAGVDVGPETLLGILRYSHSQGHTLTGGVESLDAAAILVAVRRLCTEQPVLCDTLLQTAERLLGLTAERPGRQSWRIERGTWTAPALAAEVAS